MNSFHGTEADIMKRSAHSSRREFLGKGLTCGLGAALATQEFVLPASPRPEARSPKPVSEKMLKGRTDHPQPAAFDRLDEPWYRATVARLQQQLRDAGLDAALLTDRWNIIYFTGLFHTSTERPFAIFIPAEGMSLTWFAPSLDRDLTGSWWIQDREVYFDLKHAAGGFPNEGRVAEGDPVDLTRWMWEGIRKRGFAERS